MFDVAGFFFTGAGIVPGFFFYSAEPILAVMAMTVLLLAGALSGMADPQAPMRTAKVRSSSEKRR